jgi:hypothetical protein
LHTILLCLWNIFLLKLLINWRNPTLAPKAPTCYQLEFLTPQKFTVEHKFWNRHNRDVTPPNKVFCFLLTPLPNLHVTKENQKLNDKWSLSFDMFKQGCILSLELRLTHNWRPCCNPIFVGISECTIPCPAIIHCSKRQMFD